MKLDNYVLQARIAPVLIALAPVIALFAAVAGAEDAGSWSAALLAVAATAVGLALSDAARRRGLAVQSERWRTDGSPTIQALLADTPDGQRNRDAIGRVFSLPVTSRGEAERAAAALRGHARKVGDSAVASANIEYGRARNLLGIKTFGIVTAAACLLVGLAMALNLLPDEVESLTRVPGWTAGLVVAVSVVVFAFFARQVNEAALSDMDEAYTVRLIGYLDVISTGVDGQG